MRQAGGAGEAGEAGGEKCGLTATVLVSNTVRSVRRQAVQRAVPRREAVPGFEQLFINSLAPLLPTLQLQVVLGQLFAELLQNFIVLLGHLSCRRRSLGK